VEAQRDGIAQTLYEMALVGGDPDVPDAAPQDGFVDSCAGHGTFIAGVIAQHAPGCRIEVRSLADPSGAVSEAEVMAEVMAEANKDPECRPDYLNLSFGGRSWDGSAMAGLQAAISSAQLAGIVIVASAGNDGECHPTYPAALPGVVSVGAIGPDGPAEFTNYGPWVRCCAPGVDVVSTFFTDFDGLTSAGVGGDPDRFEGWACWSGTSFSAPAVVGALIREQLLTDCSPQQAVERLIDAPGLLRIPGLGTVVNI
jgi:subtilisin family serine protease